MQKLQAALLLLPESLCVVLFGVMGWGVVALYLVFVYACMNICTEITILSRWCTIGSCLAQSSLDLRRRQVNVVVVYDTTLTCYSFYLHIKKIQNLTQCNVISLIFY